MDKELLRYTSMDAEKLAAELDYFFRQNYEKNSSYFHNPSEKEKDLYNKLMQGRFVCIKILLEDMGQGEHSYLMNRLTQHENNYPMDLIMCGKFVGLMQRILLILKMTGKVLADYTLIL